MWSEMSSDKALDEAYRRQEVFTFDTEEEAKAFAAGSWKETETIDLEGERLYSERGRDYYTEQEAVRRMDEASDEYSFIEQLSAGDKYEGEIPLEYQKFFVDGNIVRGDIAQIRNETEARADYLYETINVSRTESLYVLYEDQLSYAQLFLHHELSNPLSLKYHEDFHHT